MSQIRYSLIHKNLHRSILDLSLPGMIASVLQTLYQLVDAYWVGKLGAPALAAIGGTSFILWAVFSLTALSSSGITALVAQNIGAGKPEQARHSAFQGVLVSTLSAVVLAVIVYFSQGQLYRIMGFDTPVTLLAHAYMEVILSGLIFAFWFTAFEAVFRGIGDTRTPMFILGTALTLNAVLDPIFIFGWYGFPALGVAGAAWASILAQVFAVFLNGFWLRRKDFLPKRSARGKTLFEFTAIKRIISIGAPIGAGGFFFSLIYVGLTGIIARFGTAAIAAIGVCHRIEGIAWFASVGFSAAAATLVGQFIGAGRLRQAEKAGWLVNGYGGFTLLIVSLIYFFFPQELMGIFTTDPTVQSIGAEYLRTIAVFEIFLAFEVIVEGVFSGAGYTLPVMLVTIPITALRIPLAWFLALYTEWGINGIWWAIAFTTFIKGALNLLLFYRGVWKRKLNASNGQTSALVN